MRETQARLQHARALRTSQTDAEAKLWYHLRAHRLGGYKFRRQARIGGYIADFVCEHAKLLIELDGSQHLDRASDATRDAWCREQGYRVLRFWNDAVLKETEAVLEAILREAEASPLPDPLPQAGEGDKNEKP